MFVRLLMIISIFVVSGFAVDLAHAASDYTFGEFFKKPEKFMDRVPPKSLDQAGQKRVHPEPHFADRGRESHFVAVKKKKRWQCLRGSEKESLGFTPYAAIGRKDQPKDLLGTSDLLVHLDVMEQKGLKTARLPMKPWSGDFWPLAYGGLAARIFDIDFLLLGGWKERYDYVQQNSFLEIFRAGDSEKIEELSVAEKYDLLIGDETGQLTERSWEEGKYYYDKHGEVEGWMGLCHGWAPASYMVERPQRSITVTGVDGETPIKFYPDEIKGLVTYLWAKGYFSHRFIGSRCNEKEPELDENGRVVLPDCFDTNPGTWHISVVNGIGVQQRSFVMDATYDYEVWNQPVFAYEYNYVNLETKKAVDDLSEAMIPIKDFEQDVFKKYRADEAESLVGVRMRVGYMVESSVLDEDEDRGRRDQVVWVEYLYDLELDRDQKIIGGEWYTKRHPDFLWTATEDAQARSPLDPYVDPEAWKGDGPVPAQWRKAAQMASAQYGQVLAAVIKELVVQSRKEPQAPRTEIRR